MDKDYKNMTSQELLDELQKLQQEIAEIQISKRQAVWTEQRLKESQERFRQVAENARECIWEISAQGLYTYLSPVIEPILGYHPKEIVGKKHFRDLFDLQEYPGQEEEAEVIFQRREPFREFLSAKKHKSGQVVWFSCSGVPVVDSEGRFSGYRGVGVDVTERRKVEKELLFDRFVLNHMEDSVFWINDQGDIFYVNGSAQRMLGYSNKEMLKMTVHDIDIEFPKRDWDERWQEMKRLRSTTIESVFQGKDGKTFPVEISGNYMQYDNGEHLCVVARDITERGRVEGALRDSEQEKALILDSLSEVVIYQDKKMRLLWANRAAGESVGIDSKELIGRNYYELWHNRKAPRNCPIKNAFKTGSRQQGEVSLSKGRTWLVRGYPVKDKIGRVIGMVVVSLDITEKKKMQEERENSLDKSRRILEETVIALAATAERRDPYTAGHQRRVAQLACAIAKDMDLDEERIEGIRMASVVHDVGKVCVPVEILSKPSKLSELEFNIIKTHSRIGYEILQPVEFPWPVAQTVLQHHEKLDGSGYPNGIKGEDILLEAKIITVADVVEAMASHRPYRPALGIDKALKEITSNKGTLYDPAAVDICLKLFRKNNFKFTDKNP